VVELVDPSTLYVDFSVPQGDAAQVHAGTGLTFALRDEQGERQYSARILAVNSQVARSNRALAVRARILGSHRLARPGMFVLVQLPTAAARRRLLVPRVAIAYHSYGDFVYVLQRGRDGKCIAHEQSIRTGSVHGEEIVVRSGLKAGDWVVTAGQVKLHDGDRVRINNAVHLG
jgi:RND family efflux transporter MFP subunit